MAPARDRAQSGDDHPVIAGSISLLLKWCTQLDSNQWPLPSEGNALSS